MTAVARPVRGAPPFEAGGRDRIGGWSVGSSAVPASA